MEASVVQRGQCVRQHIRRGKLDVWVFRVLGMGGGEKKKEGGCCTCRICIDTTGPLAQRKIFQPWESDRQIPISWSADRDAQTHPVRH